MFATIASFAVAVSLALFANYMQNSNTEDSISPKVGLGHQLLLRSNKCHPPSSLSSSAFMKA
ncbi:hypothetical protein Pint_25110 [Pistacia integerrima]|uniref:Uncharacterized protein n=1 Tax=Pistacia integerrima TaxID=434235 RepID=A0ACC0YDA2_9ROSI|nr:hypothetical protein Pint_25110 [Pistacia integerrima]